MSSYSRRQLLLTAGGASVTALSGCLGAGDTDEEDPQTTDEDDSQPESNGDSSPELSLEDLRRTDEHDGVSFAVYFINPLIEAGGDHSLEAITEESVVFKVEMDTHSGDLRDFDWGEKAILSTNTGVEVDGLEWIWERESDHHPEGYYRTSKTTDDGHSIVADETEIVDLQIREMRDGTVSFSWDLQNLRDPETSPESTLRTHISNAYSGTISVIDHDGQAVTETIPVADQTSHGIAAHPTGEFVYVGGENEHIHVISTDNYDVIETIDVNSTAHGVDIHPDGQYLYVSGGGFDVEAGVVVVDVDAHEVVTRIETEGAGHVNFGPDGTYAYVSNVGENLISVIDTDAMEILTTVSVGDGPNEAVASIDGEYVYTANVTDNSVSVIETEQWEEVERIPAGEGTHGIDVSPDGQYVWTANRESNDVSLIDTATREVTETIDIGESANHLAFTPDGSAVYVTAGRADEVVVIDSRTFDVITRIDVGEEPHEIAFTGSI